MNAFVSKEELAFLPTDRINHPQHYADAQVQRSSSGFVARIKEWIGRRAVVAELNSLSDRELADIGLSRAEVGRVFNAGFGVR